MIKSECELREFINLLYDLERDEVFFVSLSARNKYLDADERIKYALSRSEMFSREFIYKRDYDSFKYVLEILKAALSYRRTGTGELYPEKAMIVYFNLNPTSTIKAYMEFQKEMNKEIAEYINDVAHGNNVDVRHKRFKNAVSILKSEFQKHPSRKIFLDVDFDTKNTNYLTLYTDFLQKNNIRFFVINTKSGYHVVLKKDTIPKGLNIYSKITELDKQLKTVEPDKEIVLNKNLMVPLPGTMQGDHLVTIQYVDM